MHQTNPKCLIVTFEWSERRRGKDVNHESNMNPRQLPVHNDSESLPLNNMSQYRL